MLYVLIQLLISLEASLLCLHDILTVMPHEFPKFDLTFSMHLTKLSICLLLDIDSLLHQGSFHAKEREKVSNATFIADMSPYDQSDFIRMRLRNLEYDERQRQ